MIKSNSEKKLLIVTQAIDQDDPVLGFFHHWVGKLAGGFERITVIALRVGKFDLPANVKVLSLGKENGCSRLKYIINFYKFLWRERRNYDRVFVHMNEEYVLLAGWWWRFAGKKISFWRNHPWGSWWTDVAVYFAHQVFCTSDRSYTSRFKKTKLMPAGIDTEKFFPDSRAAKIPRSILALGRISPIKRLEILLEALSGLVKLGVNFRATVVGSPLSATDRIYEVALHQLAEKLVRSGRLVFVPAVSAQATPELYRTHEIYVNLTPAGSLDKTIFEAMACGTLVAIDNRYAPTGLVDKLRATLDLSPSQKKQEIELGQRLVRRNHSLELLVNNLCSLL